MNGKYIYGIMDSSQELCFSTRGLLGRKPYLVSYNSLSAVVSDAPLKTYEADQKGLLAHNTVLDELIKSYSVLPMRFGTLAHSEEEIKDLLQRAYPVLKEQLLKIRDMVEFDLEVKITNEQLIINDLLNSHRGIRELREKLLSQGEAATVQDKISIGRMLAEEIAGYKINLIKTIDFSLKPYYSKCNLLGGKESLLNAAFMVRPSGLTGFESSILKLGEKYGDRLKFKYAGPLACYNFVELKLLLLNFENLDSSRRLLGLAEKISFDDIKAAYRKLAREYHPDTGHGDSRKEEEFKMISRAYKLLSAYGRHYPRSHYVFKPEEIKGESIIIDTASSYADE